MTSVKGYEVDQLCMKCGRRAKWGVYQKNGTEIEIKGWYCERCDRLEVLIGNGPERTAV
jgi:hypothetical protein